MNYKLAGLFLSCTVNCALAMDNDKKPSHKDYQKKNKVHFQLFCKDQKKFWHEVDWDENNSWKPFKRPQEWADKVEQLDNQIWSLLKWFKDQPVDLNALYTKIKKLKKNTPHNNGDIYRNLILLKFIIDNNILSHCNEGYTSIRAGWVPLINSLEIPFTNESDDYFIGIRWFFQRIATAKRKELKKAFTQKKYTNVFHQEKNIEYIKSIQKYGGIETREII